MKETNKAAFSLDYYKVSKFNYIEPNENEPLNVKFEPSGVFKSREGIFIVTFNFFATTEENERELINATMHAFFKFEGLIDFKEIPEYFYRNSIAIVFPYMRAFISTITAVANAKALIIPVLNLMALEEPLKKNTIIE